MRTLKKLGGLRLLSLLIMTVAAITFFACDSSDPVENAEPPEPLQIEVEGQDFAPAEPQLRAALGSGYWVNFSSGDRIGLFSLASDGVTILDNNVPYSYNGTAWQPVAGQPIAYKRTGASYVAYFPYDAANDGLSITQIVAGFTPNANQDFANTHANAVLMTGSGTLSGATLSITLVHALLLLEVSVPSGATGLSIYLNGTEITASSLYSVNATTYRYVVKPAATAMVNGKYSMGGNVYMWGKSLSLEAGKYTKLNIQ